jgi:hypothetical protein
VGEGRNSHRGKGDCNPDRYKAIGIKLLQLHDAKAAFAKKQLDWKQNNEKAKAAILQKVGNFAQGLVEHMDLASDMWTRLNKSYKISNDEMRNNIKMSIRNLRLQRGTDPEKHQEKFHGWFNKCNGLAFRPTLTSSS